MRKLTIHLPGATPDELARGLAAAAGVLDAHALTPEEAGVGHHLRDAWNIGGRRPEDKPSNAELSAADVWDEASAAAAGACFADSPNPPRSAVLGLIDEPEPTAPA